MRKNATMDNDKKIHIVLGTKAQLIKMAPIMKQLQRDNISYNFIFTGQHRETIDKLLENFDIKNPDTTLHHGHDITSIRQMCLWILKILYTVIKDKKQIFGTTAKNDILLTHGDTFSTLLGALMGKLAGIKVAHIESGLRSFKLFHPFPEELTRLATFHLTDYYFCPGPWALKNLIRYRGEKINTEMNTLYDALQTIIHREKSQKLHIPKEPFCLFSIHRFENIFNKKRLHEIIAHLENTAQKMKVLFILHPPTEQQLKKYHLFERLKTNPTIELRPRYNYTDFIHLLNASEFVVTDGGSNQEECYYLGIPCLLMRKGTERTEGLNHNTVISRYESETIQNFIHNYRNYRKEPIIHAKKPTEIIIDYIMQKT